MSDIQCAYCGKIVSNRFPQCPYCREELVPATLRRRGGGDPLRGAREIRRGLLYMLLAAVCYFLFGGYTSLAIPFEFAPWVLEYGLPGLFLLGAGLLVFGIIRRYS